MKKNNSKIVIYETSKKEVGLKVRLEEETLWLTQKMMAELFGVNVRTVNEHLKNIFKSRELKEKSVVRNFRITASDGKKYLTNFYNLDVIISVGYRVNSKQATKFRIWATSVLRKYLVDGYAINKKRLLEAQKNFEDLQSAVLLLQEKSQKKQLKGQEKEILSMLSKYAKALSVLSDFDAGTLKDVKGKKGRFVLKYEDCRDVISELKKGLAKKKQASDLFGNEHSGQFEGIVKGLYQTFGKKELYGNIEMKAAHLLYLTIKDHPFSDGNKRIASFLFVYFLDKNNYLLKKDGEKKINDNALVALALLIAESNPKDKDVMIKIVGNLLS